MQVKLSILHIFFILSLIFANFHTGRSEKILALALWSSQSHRITYEPLLQALVARGHNVTVGSPVPLRRPSGSPIREIQTSDLMAFYKEFNRRPSLVYDYRASWFQTFARLHLHVHFVSVASKFCAHTLQQPTVQGLLQEKFDLVLMPMLYNECSASIAHLMNVSTILISPMSVVGQLSAYYGSPSPPSFVLNAFTGVSGEMTFLERTLNFFLEAFIRASYQLIFVPTIDKTFKEHFSDSQFPTVETILKNSSLILANSHFSISHPRPYLPDIIEVGGMHCLKPKPLPEELEKFVNASDDGFLIFSMGSSLRSSDMPESKRLDILAAFSRVKQSIIWKWETETMSGLPSNVKLSKWFPQQDLLGHPKMKGFITHGGFGSTTEAACHGVPVIGIPMFADQEVNMAMASRAGVGVVIDFNELTRETLSNAIETVVTNPSFKDNAMQLSRRLLDQPDNPLDRAVYWTEYVIRHKGARHLASPARNLNFFEYHSLDVIATIAAIIGIVSWLLFLILRSVYRLLVWSITRSQKQKKH